MNQSLGFSGRTRSIKQKQHIRRFHLFGVALIGSNRKRLQFMQPIIAPIFHINIHSGSFHGDAYFHSWGQFHSLIYNTLHFNHFTTPVTAISRNNNPAVRIIDSVGKRFVTKPAINDAVDSAYFRTRKHGDNLLRNLWHVNRDDLPFFRPHTFQDIGKLTNFAVQCMVRESLNIARFPFPDQRQLIAVGIFEVPVNGIQYDIGFSPDKPTIKRWIVFIQNLIPFLIP